MNINTRVKQVFDKLQIEERQLSEILGVSFGYLSKYSSGKETVQVPANLISKIAGKFPININWIFTGEGEMFTEKYDPSDYLKDRPKHVISAEDRGIDTEICDRIRSIRSSKNLTQEAFAESLGIARHTQASIENYRQNPTAHYMRNMFWNHNISISWLVLGIGDVEHGGVESSKQVEELKQTIQDKEKFIKQLLKMLNESESK